MNDEPKIWRCHRCGEPCNSIGELDYHLKIVHKIIERIHEEEPLQSFKHTTSSIKPRFSLIPYSALVALANRYDLGEKKHKDKAWNGLSKNQECLTDEDWIVSRAEHVIHHAMTFLAKYKGLIPDDGDDDAAAIMWGGSVLVEAMRIKKDASNKNPV